MAAKRKVSLTTNHGYRWYFGTSGAYDVVFASGYYAYYPVASAQSILMDEGLSRDIANNVTFYANFETGTYVV